MKRCPKCKLSKLESEFYKDKSTKDGLKSWCKECHLSDSRQRESKYNATRRKWREENKEESRIKKKIYYINNKDKISSNSKAWSKTQSGRLFSYKKSACKRDIIWDLTEDDFFSFWQKNCHYCNSAIDTIGLDRKDSSKGYDIINVVSCCTVCNRLKLDMNYENFIFQINKIYKNILDV